MEFNTRGFPPQQLSFSRKNKAWRKQNVDFADSRSLLHYQLTRKSVYNMQINYDLINGKLHMEDLKLFLNPYNLNASFIPDGIQHYPIINSKLRVLQGEESKRVFDFRVVVTNPTAISQIENTKKEALFEQLQQLFANNSLDEEQFMQEMQKTADFFQYEYQDIREVRGNWLTNHYIRELELDQLFNQGLCDAEIVGEELYQVDIVGGEPTVIKLDPRKVRVLRSGTSDKIEDADIIIIEDYMSPGEVIDTYWDQLSKKDMQYIENIPDGYGGSYADAMDNIDERYNFANNLFIDRGAYPSHPDMFDSLELFSDETQNQLLPYDMAGNIRVMKVFWKSRRKIKKVKSYDPETGEEQFDFYPETYTCDKDKGEEEQTFWINEAWEGVKIGADIYVNMRPRLIQYNRLSNPSRCHFGIIGSIYSLNGDVPFSLVDMVKPYAYLYDIVHDKLVKTLAKNKGRVIKLDFAKVPKGWDIDKWMYFIEVNGVAIEDSFKEGNVGMATGKLAGAMNNASSGVIDAGLGNDIQQYITILEYCKNMVGELLGISKQREGQISNRETVGGVERATLQSSHITEWLFFRHESVKKRVLECLLETAKIAMKGRPAKKFEHLLSDGTIQLVTIDGDEFAECDYGLVVDNSNGTQELAQKLDVLAQAALQTQVLDFSTIMKLYTTTSIAEKQRMVEANEKRKQEEMQRQQQEQLQLQQQQLQQQQQLGEQKLQQEMQMHQEDNETKILVAQINGVAEAERLKMMNEENGITSDQQYVLEQQKLEQEAKEFEASLQKDKEKLEFEKKKHDDDVNLKMKALQQKNTKK